MELLENPNPSDRIHYAIAWVFTALCGGLGLWAAHQIRVAILLAGSVAESRQRGFRIADRFGWVILGLLWFIYIMAVADAHRAGVTQARINRIRGEVQTTKLQDRPLLRWLWKNDLHIAVGRFLRNVLIPLGVLVTAFLVSEVLRVLAIG